MAAAVGQRFVDFNLQNQDGEVKTLDDYARKWLVVYVYPKDDTPVARSGKIVYGFQGRF
jgi:peroxiredoxin Q/BCP